MWAWVLLVLAALVSLVTVYVSAVMYVEQTKTYSSASSGNIYNTLVATVGSGVNTITAVTTDTVVIVDNRVASDMSTVPKTQMTWRAVEIEAEGVSYITEVGSCMILSEDATTLALGAPYTDDGCVFVYGYDTDTNLWSQQVGPLIPEVSPAQYGVSVGLSGDGHTLAFGAPTKDSNVGAVFVYERDPVTLEWDVVTFQTLVESVDISYQGLRLDLSVDGLTLVAFAYTADQTGGHLLVYKRTARTEVSWILHSRLTPDTFQDQMNAGYVACSMDGTRLIFNSSAWYNEELQNTGGIIVYNYQTETHLYEAEETVLYHPDGAYLSQGCMSADGQVIAGFTIYGIAVWRNVAGNWILQPDFLTSGETRFYSDATGAIDYAVGINSLSISADGSRILGSGYTFPYLFLYNTETELYEVVTSGIYARACPVEIPSWDESDIYSTMSGDGLSYIVHCSNYNGFWHYGYTTAEVLTPHPGSIEHEVSDFTVASLYDSVAVGTSIAVDASGTTLVVGIPGLDNYSGGFAIMGRTGQVWTVQALSSLGDLATNDQVGNAVAISDDGASLVVGAPHSDSNAGAAYTFERTVVGEDLVWTLTNKMIVADSAYCGTSVSISGDGLTLALGSTLTNTGDGAVYIFYRANRLTNTWTSVVGITDTSSAGQLGGAVSLSTDGTVLVAGGKTYSNFKGGIRIYHTTDHVNWYLSSSYDVVGGTNGWLQVPAESYGSNYYGYAVAVSGDGQIAVVGAPQHSAYPDGGAAEGAVYIYLNQQTWWQLASQAKLMPTRSSVSCWEFGRSVALSEDGAVIVVGCTEGAFVFCRNHTTYLWEQQGDIYTFEEAPALAAVSVSKDGTTFTYSNITAQVPNAGAVNSGWFRVFSAE